MEANNITHNTGSKSVITQALDGQFLFIRIKKRAKLVSSGIEMREHDPMFDNIL